MAQQVRTRHSLAWCICHLECSQCTLQIFSHEMCAASCSWVAPEKLTHEPEAALRLESLTGLKLMAASLAAARQS